MQPEIGAALASAAPIDEAEVSRRWDAVRAAKRARDAALQAVDGPRRALRDAKIAADRAALQPQPTPADRELVDANTRAGYPAQHAELVALRTRVDGNAARRAHLESRHRRLTEQFTALRRDAESEIVGAAKLVATTLATFRLRDAVYLGPYDVVLVDEVGAASLPEVLLAVAPAHRSAVLFGDFRQLRPIVSDAPTSRVVDTWVKPDPSSMRASPRRTTRPPVRAAWC